MEATPQTTPGPVSGNGRRVAPPGSRSAAQIRDDIVRERKQLAREVDALRHRWSEVTDVKRQIRAHRTKLLAGAAVVGLAVGAIALTRRRR
jgi:type VI protein secretion system component VasF